MANKKNEMYCKMETISPAVAQIYLGRNFDKNRPIRKSRIEQLASDMKNGWYEEDNPQNALVFDKDGYLKDGQHRLSAVIKSGVTITMYVWYNVPTTTKIFDRGAGRSTSDSLIIGGADKEWANANAIAIVKVIAFMLFGSGPNSKWRWTDMKISKYAERHSHELAEACRICNGKYKAGASMNAPIRAAVYCALRYGCDPKNISDFLKIYKTGIPDEAWQTAPLLLRKFIADNAGNCNGEGYRTSLMKVTSKAILDWNNKTRRKQMYIPNRLTDKDLVYLYHVRAVDREEVKEIRGI